MESSPFLPRDRRRTAPVGEGYNTRRGRVYHVRFGEANRSSVTPSASPLPLSAGRRTCKIRLLGGEGMEPEGRGAALPPPFLQEQPPSPGRIPCGQMDFTAGGGERGGGLSQPAIDVDACADVQGL